MLLTEITKARSLSGWLLFHLDRDGMHLEEVAREMRKKRGEWTEADEQDVRICVSGWDWAVSLDWEVRDLKVSFLKLPCRV